MTKTTCADRLGPSPLPVTVQQKINVQVCWERFEALAQAGWPDPRAGGAEIVRTFRDHASDAELNELRNRIEAECHLKPHVPVGHLREHQFWLAVLEGARKAAQQSLLSSRATVAYHHHRSLFGMTKYRMDIFKPGRKPGHPEPLLWRRHDIYAHDDATATVEAEALYRAHASERTLASFYLCDSVGRPIYQSSAG